MTGFTGAPIVLKGCGKADCGIGGSAVKHLQIYGFLVLVNGHQKRE